MMTHTNTYYRYFWRDKGKLYGPTFDSYNDEEKAKEEIHRVYGSFDGDLVKKPTKDEEEKLRDRNHKKIKSMLEPLKDHYDGLRSWCHKVCIETKYGSSIHVSISGNFVSINYKKEISIRDGADDLLKDLKTRFDRRLKTAQKNKLDKKKVSLGRFNEDISDMIEEATFQICYESSNIAESDVLIVGTIKFYKKATTKVKFDVDKKKITKMNGEEIKARNSDRVINRLMQILSE